MNPLLVYIAAATLGIQVGWQPLPEGGMEYIIQLDPAALDALRDGQPLQSDIPADAGEIRAYRIIMGTGMSTPPRVNAAPETRSAARRTCQNSCLSNPRPLSRRSPGFL